MGYAFDGYAQAEFTGVSYSCNSGLAPSIVGFLPKFLPNTPIIRWGGREGCSRGGMGCMCYYIKQLASGNNAYTSV